MNFQQTIIYELKAPEFVNAFKSNCVELIIPKLMWLKQYLQSTSKQEQLDPILLIIVAFIMFQVLNTVYNGLFSKKQSSLSGTNSNNDSPSRQLIIQMAGLKKQLKNMQQSFKKLQIQSNNQANSQSNIKNTSNISKNPKNGNNLNTNNNNNNASSLIKTCHKILPVYESAIQNNKNLALFIIQAQQQIFKELKKLKKNRLSLSLSQAGSTLRDSVRTKEKRQTKSPKKTIVSKQLYKESVLKSEVIVAKKQNTESQFLIKQTRSQIRTTKSEVKTSEQNYQTNQSVQNFPSPIKILKNNEKQKLRPIQNHRVFYEDKTQQQKPQAEVKVKQVNAKVNLNVNVKVNIKEETNINLFQNPIQNKDKNKDNLQQLQQIRHQSNIQQNKTTIQQKQVTFNPPPPPTMKKFAPPTGAKNMDKRKVPPPPMTKK